MAAEVVYEGGRSKNKSKSTSKDKGKCTSSGRTPDEAVADMIDGIKPPEAAVAAVYDDGSGESTSKSKDKENSTSKDKGKSTRNSSRTPEVPVAKMADGINHDDIDDIKSPPKRRLLRSVMMVRARALEEKDKSKITSKQKSKKSKSKKSKSKSNTDNADNVLKKKTNICQHAR